jgi:hypothetical protein
VAVCYRRSPQAEFQMLDEEGVVLNMDSGRYFRLNSTGVAVWESVNGVVTMEELVRRVSSAYGRSDATIGNDVRVSVRKLVTLGLLAESEN